MHEHFHEIYMQRCLQLAKLGAGQVAPNPMVGSVLVHENQVIGEGYHQKYGAPHAEVNCINNALQRHADKISFSTLYVSLEPCAHFGKTPPCADLIIKHKMPKVVIACRDSFKEVDGKGIEKLKSAGVSVEVSILEGEAISLNKAFFTFHEKHRPYIILKWAQTADGFIAADGKERLHISNSYSNRLVHKWRSEAASIMVGANTAISDDPLLDNRHWFGPKPKKIIVDQNLKVPLTIKLFQQGDEVLVINELKNGKEGNALYIKIKGRKIDHILDALYQHQIQSVFVEGGQKLLQSFIDSNLWDEARVITNNNLYIHNGLQAPLLKGGLLLRQDSLQTDGLSFFKNKDNHFLDAASTLF